MACNYFIDGKKLSKDEFLNYVKKQPLDESSRILGIKATPSAPIISDTSQYTKLALKVALQHAIKEGVDKIAWTTGEQQNKRYDLSKQLDEIGWQKNKNGTYNITPKKDGSVVGTRDMMANLTIKQVEDYVGKDIAEKIEAEEGKEWDGGDVKQGRLSGLQLAVGGKGMIGFYGSPKEGKLGIVGQVAESMFGKGSVKTTEINANHPKEIVAEKYGINQIANDKYGKSFRVLPHDDQMEVLLDAKKKGIDTAKFGSEYSKASLTEDATQSTQHSIGITPEIKESVKSGLPLFGTENRIASLKKQLKEAKDRRSNMGIMDNLNEENARINALYTDLAIEYIKQGVKKFADFLSEIGEETSDALKEIWDKAVINHTFDQLDNDKKTVMGRINEARKSLEGFDEVAENAIFVEENFSDVIKELEKQDKIKVEC